MLETLKMVRPLVAIDVETTGLNPQRDRIIQIGVVRVKMDKTTKEWTTLINPGIPITNSMIHGITNEHVKNEQGFEVIATSLYRMLRDCDLCGYNVEFDIKFIAEEFKRVRIAFTPGKIIDSFNIFKNKEPRNLTAAVKFYLNEDLEGAHQALTDAWAALKIFDAQIKKYPDLTLEKIEALGKDEKLIWCNGEMVINFGKHKGILLKDIPLDYLHWMKSAKFSSKVKNIISEALEGRFPKKMKKVKA